MIKKYCKKCNKFYNVGKKSKFCRICGTKLETNVANLKINKLPIIDGILYFLPDECSFMYNGDCRYLCSINFADIKNKISATQLINKLDEVNKKSSKKYTVSFNVDPSYNVSYFIVRYSPDDDTNSLCIYFPDEYICEVANIVGFSEETSSRIRRTLSIYNGLSDEVKSKIQQD